MIKIGTLCLVKYAPGRKDLLGYQCEVIEIVKNDQHTNLLRFKSGEIVPGADICLLPITPDQALDELVNKMELVT